MVLVESPTDRIGRTLYLRRKVKLGLKGPPYKRRAPGNKIRGRSSIRRVVRIESHLTRVHLPTSPMVFRVYDNHRRVLKNYPPPLPPSLCPRQTGCLARSSGDGVRCAA